MNRLLLTLLIGWLFFSYNATGEPDQVEQTLCVQHAEDAFKRLNVLLTENHLLPLELDPVHLVITQPRDRQRKTNIWQIRTASYTVLQFLPKSCALISIYRDTYKDALLYDGPPKPTWTENQAIENAKKWVTAFLNYFPDNVGTPKIGFVDQRKVPEYYDGHWRIRWARTDSQGHRFDGDALSVELGEKQGLISISLNFYSTFDEIHDKLISEEDAIATSHSSAEILLHSELVRPLLPPGLKLGTATASLWIMNPTHLLQSKTLDEASASEEIKARLAWVVVYTLMDGNAPASYHTLEVWIDAQTKEAIGGDFK